MIVTRGLSIDASDKQNGNISLYGLGLTDMKPPLLKINMDGQMQNLDGGMRG
jgi:hypothetical protein